jgi:hypothetical protein
MYTNPLQFEIEYECTEHLIHGARACGGAAAAPLAARDIAPPFFSQRRADAETRRRCATAADLEWKITYVGSAEDDRYDQARSRLLACASLAPFILFACHVGASRLRAPWRRRSRIRAPQVLDSVLVGPVTPGPFRFVFQARGGACARPRAPGF